MIINIVNTRTSVSTAIDDCSQHLFKMTQPEQNLMSCGSWASYCTDKCWYSLAGCAQHPDNSCRD